jgi:hypothetical protein
VGEEAEQSLFVGMMVMTTPTVIATGTSAEGLSRSHVAHARLRGRGSGVPLADHDHQSRLHHTIVAIGYDQGVAVVRCAGPG